MKINAERISTTFDRERCYVHARGVMLDDGFGIITMQKLELSGCDLFHGIEMIRTEDGGRSFSEPQMAKGLKRQYLDDGTSRVMCDATPFYHKGTGKIILVGHLAQYGADGKGVYPPRRRSTTYAVYDRESGDFGESRTIELIDPDGRYFSAGSGCSQITELESGELLIPFYFTDYEGACDIWKNCFKVAVMRCSFDGETIVAREIGNTLTVDVPRGLCEPSVTHFNGAYFLALRNDMYGYVARSEDGIRYGEPQKLVFDDGEELGNYNTQQHWLVGGGKLWLVYTRKAGNNDHVFRHRAPLFVAEFDTEKMAVVRESERIAVPERGARLGNFGCQSFSEGEGIVYAAEWMQGDAGLEGCEKYGSDNSIFISRINYGE